MTKSRLTIYHSKATNTMDFRQGKFRYEPIQIPVEYSFVLVGSCSVENEDFSPIRNWTPESICMLPPSCTNCVLPCLFHYCAKVLVNFHQEFLFVLFTRWYVVDTRSELIRIVWLVITGINSVYHQGKSTPTLRNRITFGNGPNVLP